MKPRVLVGLGHYLPGDKSGGPVRTVAAMVEQLSDDFEFSIIATDRDMGDDHPYQDVPTDQWSTLGKASVFHTSSGARSLRALAGVIRETPHDVLYLNSYFDPVFTIRPLVARSLGLIPRRPTILAPRGALSPVALQLKRWKKSLFRAATGMSNMYSDLVWQASNEHEADEIRRAMGRRAERVVIAQDMLLAPDDGAWTTPPERGPGDPFRVCFVGRISPKKNLDVALRILSQVRALLRFDIYGPIEDRAYWRVCQAIIAAAPNHVSIAYHGSVGHDQVHGIFKAADLFLFPTRGENFGHVVIESMLAGTPVLISTSTPWRGLEAVGVGWDLPVDQPHAFVAAIERSAAISTRDFSEWRARVRQYGLRRFADPSVLASNRDLFLRAAATR